jgi:hypothetical protein
MVPTYEQIQEEIKRRFHVSVKTCWMVDIKERHGLTRGPAWNRLKSQSMPAKIPGDCRGSHARPRHDLMPVPAALVVTPSRSVTSLALRGFPSLIRLRSLSLVVKDLLIRYAPNPAAIIL